MSASFFSRRIDSLKQGLAKSRESLARNLSRIVGAKQPRDEVLEQIEEMLIGADLGVRTSQEIIEKVRQSGSAIDEETVKNAIRQEIMEIFACTRMQQGSPESKPYVILVVGVNGTGKTTTIAKLAHRYRCDGKSVLLAAADTFRAAAIEQLEIWANRVGADIVKQKPGADAASVAFDACKAASSRGIDVVIVDTAGRLQTKRNLMDEIAKVRRVVGKVVESAPHEVLLVLDATTGQNAISQARAFGQSCGVTGIVIAKLDGTAKGGIVVAIARELGIPIQYVGTGESLEDLQEFDPSSFVEALLG